MVSKYYYKPDPNDEKVFEKEKIKCSNLVDKVKL
jgi:hypothetical protein